MTFRLALRHLAAALRLLLIVGFLGLLTSAARAALAGTYAVGPTGAYPTLTAAVADLQVQGMIAPVIFELQAAYTGGGETFPINFTNLPTTAVNTLTVRPALGATNLVITSAAAQTVNLDNGTFVTIDGRAGGIGTTRHLTIENTNTSGAAVQWINGASNNTLQFLNLQGRNTAATAGTVVFSTSTDATGNNGNTIVSCNFQPSAAAEYVCAIFSAGSTGLENSGNTISSCTIADCFSATLANTAVLLGANNSAWTLTGNRIFQTASRTYTVGFTHAAIRISSGDAHQITGNTIGFANAGGTGTWTYSGSVGTRFITLDLAVGTTTATSVQGNVISGFRGGTSSAASTSNGVWCGINVTAGNVNIGTTTANTIGGASGVDQILVESSSAGALVVGMNLAGAGTVVVQSNVIGGLTSANATVASVGAAVTGIQLSGSGTYNILQNTIGGTTAHSLRSGASGLTTGSTLASGINSVTITGTLTIDANTIQNLSSFGTGNAGFVRGIWTGGSSSAAAAHVISGNTVRDLQTASTLTTVPNGAAAATGITLAFGNNGSVTGNTIFAISRTNAATAAGFVVGIASANAINTTITGNRIYDLRNASTSTNAATPGIVAGVLIRSGTTAVTVATNMISLGTGQATDTAFIGIMGNHGSTPEPVDRIYYNTIEIAGTAPGGGVQSSFGFHRGDFSASTRVATIDFRNNLVTNTRTGGTGKHYAIANNFGAAVSATGWGAGASNFNVLNANAATIGHWGGDQTIAGWRTASAGDALSPSSVAVTFAGSPSNLRLAMGVTPTQIESGGTAVAGVTADIDGLARPAPGAVNGGGQAPDIGADEFDGVPLDVFPPEFTFQPLLGSRTVGPTLSAVRIFDRSGVTTAGALRPRIYYRKNAGAWFSQPGMLTSGTAVDGQWSFPVVAADVGGLVPGDVISYYLVAQDLASLPNLSSSPAGAVGSNVNNITTPPTTPLTVNVFADLNGTVTVGAGGNFPTLTAAVAAYNAGVSTGPVLMQLTDATYPGESFPIVINESPAASPTNTLTIKPAPGVQPVISGSSATSIIQINGASYVMLDGHNGTTVNSLTPRVAATRDLTITNTNISSTSAVVWINATTVGEPSEHCTVQNCVISGSGSAATLAGLGAGGSAIGSAGRNDDLKFINNDIRACQLSITSTGESIANKSQGIEIRQNVINSAAPNSIGRVGINLNSTDTASITANAVGEIISNLSIDVLGISVGYGVSTAATSVGTLNGVTNATITDNLIGRIVQTGTFSAVGIAFNATDTGSALIANNSISGVASNGTGGDVGAGIQIGGGTAPVKVYHNTVAMQGDSGAGGTQSSTCLAVSSAAAPTALEVRNNIFSITQFGSGGSTTRFAAVALGFGAPYTGFLSDRNALYSAGPGPGSYATCITGGVVGGVSRSTLADWQTETGQDANSLDVTPTFVSATDLHLAVENQPVVGAGTPLAEVTSDFDLNPRNAAPDLGADEFFPSANAGLVNLGLSTGSLSPGFSNSVVSYNVALLNATNTLSVVPSSLRSFSTIAVNGVAVTSGGTSPSFALVEGDNLINVVVTAQDGVTQKTYAVTVHRNVKPALTLPTSPLLAEATAATGAIVNFAVSANDAEDGALTPTAAPTSGSLFALGDTTVNVSATDLSGETTSGSFTVRVRDTTPPTIGGTFSPLIAFAGTLPDYRGQAVTSDLVGVTSVTQTPAPGTATAFGRVDVTLTASDAAGNSKDLTFTVDVRPLVAVNSVALATGAPAPGAGTNGLPAGATLASFGLPAVSDAGDVAFVGKWAATVSGKAVKGTGLFLNNSCLAVIGGDASAIGGASAKWVSFSDPVAEDGKLASLAKLSTGATAVVSNFTGAALEKIALTGETAAGAGDAKFKKFTAVALRGGAIGFLATLTGGTAANKVTPANDLGIWARETAGTLDVLYRESFALGGGKTVGSFVSFLPGNGSPGAGRGWLSENGGPLALSLNTFTDKTKAIGFGGVGGFSFVAQSGEIGTNLAPVLAGASFESFRLPAMNDALDVAFYATMKAGAGAVTKADAGAIFATMADFTGSLAPSELIARLGSDAGATGGKFTALRDPVLAQDGALAFSATIKGATIKGAAATTLWWRPATGGPLKLLAQGGGLNGEPTDLPSGSQWKSFSALAIAADRGPIFVGSLVPKVGAATAANASGLWAMDFAGTLRTLFRTGDTIGGKTLKSFTILKATVGNAGVTRSFSDTAQVVWLATFTDKTTAIVTTDVP